MRKQYCVSNFSIGLFIVILSWLVVMAFFSFDDLKDFISDYRHGIISVAYLLNPLLELIGIVACGHIAVNDMPFAKIIVSENGITESMGLKRYDHTWIEFVEYGILGINMRPVKRASRADTYWVYFSTSPLTPQERIAFLRKTRKDLNRIAFFQYNKTTLREIMPILPDAIASTLDRQSEEIEQQMNRLKRL